MNRILVNTVGNALKYTDSGGKVEVIITEGVKATNGKALYEFIVRDTGRGMTKEFAERIFMPFERDSLGSAHGEEGTGLGMAITKNLVDIMGGTISLKTEVGVGSEFLITLPLKLQETQSDSCKIADDEIEREYDFTGRRVLVVDDDELSREMMVGILGKKGFHVETAIDGENAVEVFEASEEGHFDAIIMDMRMPRMTGDDATRAIRELPRSDVANLPIIAATADAFEEGYRRAREAGMTDHITKPLDSKKLFALLDGYLK